MTGRQTVGRIPKELDFGLLPEFTPWASSGAFVTARGPPIYLTEDHSSENPFTIASRQ